MLQITIPATEKWDEVKEEFVYSKAYTIRLEHSLVSLSKWESVYCKPFLSKNKMTIMESIDYVRFMTLTQNVPPEAYYNLTEANMKAIEAYIDAPMTATWFSEEEKTKALPSRRVITSELIYSWMISLNIPLEWEKRHLNRLLALIKVCNIESQPPKKRSKRDLLTRNRELNAERRKKLNTTG